MMRLAILVVALFAGLQTTVAVATHVVGDTTGWVVPAEGPIFYAAWSAKQTFILGEILYFNFTTGAEDVARVTAEAFLTCNSTNPISLVKTGTANFSLNSTGEYYFISTLDRSCFLGQKLAINVTTSPGPTSRTVPENYTVGKSRRLLIDGDTPGPEPAPQSFCNLLASLRKSSVWDNLLASLRKSSVWDDLLASLRKSSVWDNIAKELGTGIVSGIIGQIIFCIMLQCFKPMLNTFRQQPPQPSSVPPVGLEEEQPPQPSSVPPVGQEEQQPPQPSSVPPVGQEEQQPPQPSSVPPVGQDEQQPPQPSSPANPVKQGSLFISTLSRAARVTSTALNDGADAVNEAVTLMTSRANGGVHAVNHAVSRAVRRTNGHGKLKLPKTCQGNIWQHIKKKTSRKGS